MIGTIVRSGSPTNVVTRVARPASAVVRDGVTARAVVAGIVVLGVYPTLAALQAAHPTGAPGDAYTAAGDLYLWDAAANAWNDVGPLQGPAGAPGQIRFTGMGPPPAFIVGAEPSDTYMDLATGDVYKLV